MHLMVTISHITCICLETLVSHKPMSNPLRGWWLCNAWLFITLGQRCICFHELKSLYPMSTESTNYWLKMWLLLKSLLIWSTKVAIFHSVQHTCISHLHGASIILLLIPTCSPYVSNLTHENLLCYYLNWFTWIATHNS